MPFRMANPAFYPQPATRNPQQTQIHAVPLRGAPLVMLAYHTLAGRCRCWPPPSAATCLASHGYIAGRRPPPPLVHPYPIPTHPGTVPTHLSTTTPLVAAATSSEPGLSYPHPTQMHACSAAQGSSPGNAGVPLQDDAVVGRSHVAAMCMRPMSTSQAPSPPPTHLSKLTPLLAAAICNPPPGSVAGALPLPTTRTPHRYPLTCPR